MSKLPVVAIVDDDEAVREALSELLQVTGHATRSFDRAEALLADPQIGDFGCIITDVRMPGISGHELQERLRNQGSELPVIFLTSAVDAAARGRAMDAGAHAYLSKPVAEDVLLAYLRSALDGAKAPRAD